MRRFVGMRSFAIVAAVLVSSGLAVATPREFATEVTSLYKNVACGDPDKTVATHCAALAKTTDAWKSKWRDKAAPWFRELLGKRTNAVVYPFGGGDLSSALVVYPDATEYTTISLEGMGDPRATVTIEGLAKMRTMLAANLGWAWNTTSQLSIDSSESGVGIPNILATSLVALAANGYEPIEARYFTLGAGGAIAYVTTDDVTAWDARPKARVVHKADQALQVGLFNNVEIVFRAKGDANAPKKTFRHIASDLSDRGAQATFDHLDAKRDIVTMTKAASYLLWKPEFGKLRGILLARMTAMISDDTGIPPHLATGFTQDVWGTYAGAFFTWADKATQKEFVEFYKAHSKGAAPFRFGYYDSKRTSHLMFTHK